MPIDEGVLRAMSELRKEWSDGLASFRNEYHTAHEALRQQVTQLAVQNAEILTRQTTVLDRLSDVNGTMGEHTGKLALQEGMLNGYTDRFEELDEKISDQITVCANTRNANIWST